MTNVIIKNANSGRKHTLNKFAKQNEIVNEYFLLDFILAADKTAFLNEHTNAIVDSVDTLDDTTYIKFHVDWESERSLYDEDGDFVKTETEITTAPYLMIIGK